MDETHSCSGSCSRRDFLRTGLFGLGAAAGLPYFLRETGLVLAADAARGELAHPNRILVVVELAGGIDALNTVVPYFHDAYYRARPTLAIPKEKLIRMDDKFGFHPSLAGFEGLWKDGRMAVVHGCGYENPTMSHFQAMDWWHTAVPHGADTLGWVGRLADAESPEPKHNYVVNIAQKASLAVRSGVHAPVIFDDPARFGRKGESESPEVFRAITRFEASGNPALDYVSSVTTTAADSSELVRSACADYKTLVDYGLVGGHGSIAGNLRKVSALIAEGIGTRIFYLNMGGFDTHVAQAPALGPLLIYLGDAIRGFFEDVERLGRSDDVAVLMFTEFGRRVEENASKGTDHGAASPMYLLGKKVKGGFYGTFPSLTELDANGNLEMTCDFRRVYATVIREWMGFADVKKVLKADYETFGAFA
jgi:uncharacterized protein (DUF1501 family)